MTLMAIALNTALSSQFQTQNGIIVLCSWRRHFTLTVPLLTQGWVVQNKINYSGLL